MATSRALLNLVPKRLPVQPTRSYLGYWGHYKDKAKDAEFFSGPFKYIFWAPFRRGPDPNHGFTYRRSLTLQAKSRVVMAEAMMALYWTWFFFHVLTEPGHLVGEYPFRDISDFTDEELGIPKS